MTTRNLPTSIALTAAALIATSGFAAAAAQSGSTFQTGARTVFAEQQPWIQQTSLQCLGGHCGPGEPACDPCVSGDPCASADCCGEPFEGCCAESTCCTQTNLLGNVFGPTSPMAAQGIVADIQLTQFYQGVSSGGATQDSAYGGKADYMFTFLGKPLGINEGFTASLHAETRYGQDINGFAGPLGLPNANMLYPLPGENETAITGLMVIQAFSEEFAVTAGKYNLLDLWQMLYPNTGRGIEGFMNLSMLTPIPLIRTTNLSVNGAGALFLEDKQIKAALLVYDTNNSSTTTGLSDLFDRGAVVLGYWRHFTEMNGLPGSHAIMGNWSSREFTSLDRTSWTVIPGQGVVAGTESGSWTLGYVLDQVVWADPCNKDRNVRLMTQWMLADGNPNLYRWSGNIALQASGLISGRELDTAGVGYFFDGISNSFERLVAPVVAVQDVQGAEMYYNAAVTPWFHVTASLQVVDNANAAQNTAVMPGIRANIRF